MEELRFIDLFAGLGGIRLGLEQACQDLGIKSHCVFTSEIKPYAIKAYQSNFSETEIAGDICQVKADEIPDFDMLLAGFPCQPFSAAGNRAGFMDTRGTLFFEIERILAAKRPRAFLLENVEGLVGHDRIDKHQKIGRTLQTILDKLAALGYQVSWALLDGKDFGVAQSRKRVYIVGTNTKEISLEDFPKTKQVLGDILERNQNPMNTEFTKILLSHYAPHELYGKAIKDKRGGENNIHSWDIELKGATSPEQRALLSSILKQRRRKQWAEEKGIEWMDGMPLTLAEIRKFYQEDSLFGLHNLEAMLDDLVAKGYLRYEHPKDVVETYDNEGRLYKKREYAEDLPKGYNIVVGKLSFEISKILDPHDIAPTLVATDVTRLAVVDGNGLRRLSVREGLRLFGFPESYQLNIPYNDAFDLLGNTVVIPAIEAIAKRILGVSQQELVTDSVPYVQRSFF